MGRRRGPKLGNLYPRLGTWEMALPIGDKHVRDFWKDRGQSIDPPGGPLSGQ